MKELHDLRQILSQNIKKARSLLHITQAKLALYSDISLPHIIEIEQCKTWVSDRTLANIAKALNLEVYELFILENSEKNREFGKKDKAIKQIAELVKTKKIQLRKNIDESLSNLIMDINKLVEKN
ncbi:MAG: helix-turn-helix domain-containing protein [Treponema sp.]|jgi:transcriptional regulator with XRE-family HTH domain|nr:helix-turn-helix domain-containing protein [Treponema sp.]